MSIGAIKGFVVIGLALVTGCVKPVGPPQTDVCDTGYFVGCDENADALRLRDEFGLLQITNTTKRIDSEQPVLASGIVYWSDQAHPDPGSRFAFEIDAAIHHELPSGFDFRNSTGYFGHAGYPGPGLVVFGETYSDNGAANYSQSRLVRWSLKSGNAEALELPERGPFFVANRRDSFSHPWMLLLEAPSDAGSAKGQQKGLVAFNIENGAWRRLENQVATDSSYYGRPLLDYRVHDGSAFLAYSREDLRIVESALVEVILETGERIERDRWTGSYFTVLQTSESYVVYARPWEGTTKLVAYDRKTHEVKPLGIDDSAGAEWVRVGREWVLYEQNVPGPNPVVGEKVSTGERRVFVNGSEDWDWIELDIEEPWIVVEIAPTDFSSLKMERGQIFLHRIDDTDRAGTGRAPR